jgi:hypothetical protein
MTSDIREPLLSSRLEHAESPGCGEDATEPEARFSRLDVVHRLRSASVVDEAIKAESPRSMVDRGPFAFVSSRALDFVFVSFPALTNSLR